MTKEGDDVFRAAFAHPSLMLASRTTRLHFSISAATKGEIADAVDLPIMTSKVRDKAALNQFRSNTVDYGAPLAFLGKLKSLFFMRLRCYL